jgi:hypothetical protein
MSEEARSELACPICSKHTLALDRPPHIDVMGVQQYSDIIGMGDLGPEGPIGIVCLSCGTHWRDRDAFERGEPELDAAAGPVDVSEPASEDS